ncbi:MAG: hypothetical protein SVR94_18480, partial [Pseudomonadota bacterium]|nr:hypothetical protein [Pseudomonadota bacterium]
MVGRSGCGKSSLVRTGMLAGLEAGFLAKAGVRWKTEEFRPSSEEPLIQLSNRLLEKSFLDEKYLGDFENNVEFTEKIKISQETLKR